MTIYALGDSFRLVRFSLWMGDTRLCMWTNCRILSEAKKKICYDPCSLAFLAQFCKEWNLTCRSSIPEKVFATFLFQVLVHTNSPFLEVPHNDLCKMCFHQILQIVWILVFMLNSKVKCNFLLLDCEQISLYKAYTLLCSYFGQQKEPVSKCSSAYSHIYPINLHFWGNFPTVYRILRNIWFSVTCF